jgi:DNA helicase II / ATP-dependent DNA helicase PcrA
MSNGLNPEQNTAVQTLSGPLLVLAGAGSGKTRVVTFRIANLIKHGIRPDRILAVTFTNKAAREMRERITSMLGGKKKRRNRGEPAAPTPVIGTFHANCVQILRRHATRLGYPPRFAIYDRSDQEAVAREVLRQLRVGDGMLKPSEFLNHISRWKNAGVSIHGAAELARSDAEHIAASGYRRYQQSVKLAGAMDFDDLLLLTEQLFRQFEEVRVEESGRFDHVLVDEYQDTNQTQYSIIKQLATHRNLCVVGDDDQSIYGWRGAEVQHILNFRNDWPDAKVVRLEANYRSTASILEVANRLIAFNKVRHDKVLRAARSGGRAPRILQFKNDVEEAKGITQEIQRIVDRATFQFKDIAILFRTNEQPRVFETELRKAKVPYTLTGSQSFFDRKEVRDLLGYLKVLDNPKDEVSLLRIINTPPRGVGTKTVDHLLKSAVSQGRCVWEAMQDNLVTSTFPEPARRGLKSLQNLVEQYARRLATEESLASVVNQLIGDIDYLDAIARTYDEPEEIEARQASVGEVLNAIAQYEEEADEPTLAGFLDNVALAGKEFGDSKEKERHNALSLMTYHSAKGLEFPIVYMVGMEEGILPHRRSLAEDFDDVEEERRLCYVGITRAQDELTLSLPLQRMKWGKPRDTIASRFLYELTGQADNPNRQRAMEAARKEVNAAKRYAAGGGKPKPGKK